MAEIDLVLEDATNSLFLEGNEFVWLVATRRPFSRVQDAVVLKVLKNLSNRSLAFKCIVDIASNDLRFTRMDDEALGSSILTIAVKKPAIPHALLGPILHRQAGPLSDDATFIFRLTDGHVAHVPALGAGRIVHVVNRQKLNPMLLKQAFNSPKVVGIPAQPVDLERQHDIDGPLTNSLLHSQELRPFEVLAGFSHLLVELYGFDWNTGFTPLIHDPLHTVSLGRDRVAFDRAVRVRNSQIADNAKCVPGGFFEKRWL